MRWKRKVLTSNDTRVVLKFLLLPRCFDGEGRWLEWAYIKETVCAVGFDRSGDVVWGWKEVSFATEKEYWECLHG
jgi:hypothetical protein